MKFGKQQPPKPVPAETTAKARLRNVGNGTLALVGNTIKFYVEKGSFRKQKLIAKEIPIADIESIERTENEISITCKGVTDRFVVEKTELAVLLHTKITEAVAMQGKPLEAPKEAQEEAPVEAPKEAAKEEAPKEALEQPPKEIPKEIPKETVKEVPKEEPKQKPIELAPAISYAMKIADSLFDVLRSLHGRVDWNRVETQLKHSKECIRSFTDQKDAPNLDVAKLSSAIKEHLPEEISKEAYALVKALLEFFNAPAPQGEAAAQVHPNNDDARKVILAYYTLNDIVLGILVEDEEIRKESNELAAMLGDLSKITGLQISVDAFKAVINKLDIEKDRENVIEESRAVFAQQLQALIAPQPLPPETASNSANKAS
jgi:hypothetical protein